MFLSKRKGGVYYLYYKNPTTKKRVKISTRATKKSDALKFMYEYTHRAPLEVPQKVIKQITLDDLRTTVLSYAKVNYEPKTYEMYKYILKNLISFLGNRQVVSLSMRDFEDYKAFRAQQVSKTTVNIEIQLIKAAFYTGIRYELIQKNPIVGVRKFTIPQKDRLSFENDEVRLLLSCVIRPEIKKVVLFALYTGCRLSEIINVQIKDIDLINRLLLIRNKPNFKTKTGRNRQIPIGKGLFSLLEEVCFLNEMKKGAEDYLFTIDGANPLKKSHVSRIFKKSLRIAGLSERYHFHCLRHTFITNLIKGGVNINYVKELAGHTEIETTMNYIHIGVEDLRDAVECIRIVA